MDQDVDEFAAETAQRVEPDRWGGIQEALRAPVRHLALVNCFTAADVQERICASQGLSPHEEIPDLLDCPDQPPSDPQAAAFRAAAAIGDEAEGALPRVAAAQGCSPEAPLPLLPCCFVSGASALAAQALSVAPGEKVLDLWAGPGAKALVLAAALFGQGRGGCDQASALELAGAEAGVLAAPEAGLLVCNEPQRQRCALLEGVLAAFLPEQMLGRHGRVLVTKCEASAKVPPVLRRHAPFDKVLVDPPCISARALAKRRGRSAQQDPAAVKKNADLMEELLRCAGALVKPGGLIVFATSSLEDEENNEVVRRFLRREGGQFKAEEGQDDSPIAGAEKTPFGTLILPDQGTMHGPLYFSKLRRA